MAFDSGSGVLHESDHVLDLAVRGDAAALDRLFGPCMPQLQKTAARLLGNTEDAEDALQDGLLSAFRHLDQFQGRARFTTWMHTIVANAAKSKLRRQRSQPFILSLDEPEPEHEQIRLADTLADPQTNLDDGYAQREEFRILATILDELPSVLRVVVLLCDIQGFRLKEAAAQLGVTISAVKSRHFRASRLLLKMAGKAGVHSRPNNHTGKTVRRPRRLAHAGLGSGEPYEDSVRNSTLFVEGTSSTNFPAPTSEERLCHPIGFEIHQRF